MKKLLTIVAVVAMAMAVVSCGKTEKGNPEADSLRNVLSGSMAEMDEMNLFLDAVNVSMDSIVNMEGMILRTSGETQLSSKEQIKQNLEAFKMMLATQRERIAILEKKLKDGDANAQKMLQTIKSLQKQLEEKDQAIVELTEELEKRNFDIQTLKAHVDRLNVDVARLTEQNTAQEEALVAQTDAMNEAYVFIGSKQELKAAGLLSGGSLLKKSKLDMSASDLSKFKKIDIRKTKSFSIPGKKPQVLTQVPGGSYTITDNGDGTSTLTVTDASSFWSISNYLIIRADK